MRISHPPFRLCLVTDRRLAGVGGLAAAAARAIEGGVDAVEVREKDLEARELTSLCREILESADGRARLLVNDRVDVAMTVPGAGAHLPADGLPPATARGLLGPGRLIGVSAHGLDRAREAEDGGADYIFVGPVFETASKKKYGPPIGLATLEAVQAAVSIPVFAIGGVTPARVAEAMGAGASGVAVISGILGRDDIEAAAGEYVLAMEKFLEDMN